MEDKMSVTSEIKKLNYAFGVSLLILSTYAFSQDNRSAELAKADRDLNAIYGKINDKLSMSDKTKFRNSQRAWIAMRDLDCQWAFRLQPLDCAIDRTINRVAELERTFFVNSKGNYISIETEEK